jgi:hypothetical protein
MGRITAVRYKKRYMTKAVYTCKRYTFYIPVAIGDRLDLSIDYEVQFQDPVILLTPKNLKTVQHVIEETEERQTSAS